MAQESEDIKNQKAGAPWGLKVNRKKKDVAEKMTTAQFLKKHSVERSNTNAQSPYAYRERNQKQHIKHITNHEKKGFKG